MGGLSLWHWLVVVIIVLLLFGKGRISDMMGDLGKGLKSFKRGMAEDEEEAAAKTAQPRQLPREQQPIDITPAAPPPSAEAAPPPPPPASGDEPPRG